MSALPISAVIITKNEADNIGRCLQPIQSLFDEIIVLDAFSEDNTVKIARQYGAVVHQREWVNYSYNKNIANNLATHDWIFSIDADEEVTPILANALRSISLEKDAVFSINRIVIWQGRKIKHSGWHPDWKVRLFPKSQVKWQGDFVHESLDIPTHFKKNRLPGLLHHYSYKDDQDHLDRIEKYALLSAKSLHQQGKKATFLKRFIAPIARFIRTFFIKKGILDGRLGWKIACRDVWLVYRKYQLLKEFKKK